MKTNILSIVMGCLLIVGLTSMISLNPTAKAYDCATDCEFITAELGISWGQCMSFCRTCTNEGQGKGVAAVCECNFYEAIGVLEEEGINFGQCVKLLKSGQ